MNTQESNGNSIRRSAHHRNQVVTESNPFVNLTRVRKRDQQSREVLGNLIDKNFDSHLCHKNYMKTNPLIK